MLHAASYSNQAIVYYDEMIAICNMQFKTNCKKEKSKTF